MFLDFFFCSDEIYLFAPLGYFQFAVRDLLTLLHTSTSEIPTLLNIRSLKKV